jgi:hypothetical protein
MTFGVDPDTHIDTTEQAKASTIEGTSKWSCKLSITGTNSTQKHLLNESLHSMTIIFYPQIFATNFHIKIHK